MKSVTIKASSFSACAHNASNSPGVLISCTIPVSNFVRDNRSVSVFVDGMACVGAAGAVVGIDAGALAATFVGTGKGAATVAVGTGLVGDVILERR